MPAELHQQPWAIGPKGASQARGLSRQPIDHAPPDLPIHYWLYATKRGRRLRSLAVWRVCHASAVQQPWAVVGDGDGAAVADRLMFLASAT
jgi:hypothetical protein